MEDIQGAGFTPKKIPFFDFRVWPTNMKFEARMRMAEKASEPVIADLKLKQKDLDEKKYSTTDKYVHVKEQQQQRKSSFMFSVENSLLKQVCKVVKDSLPNSLKTFTQKAKSNSLKKFSQKAKSTSLKKSSKETIADQLPLTKPLDEDDVGFQFVPHIFFSTVLQRKADEHDFDSADVIARFFKSLPPGGLSNSLRAELLYQVMTCYDQERDDTLLDYLKYICLYVDSLPADMERYLIGWAERPEVADFSGKLVFDALIYRHSKGPGHEWTRLDFQDAERKVFVFDPSPIWNLDEGFVPQGQGAREVLAQLSLVNVKRRARKVSKVRIDDTLKPVVPRLNAVECFLLETYTACYALDDFENQEFGIQQHEKLWFKCVSKDKQFAKVMKDSNRQMQGWVPFNHIAIYFEG